MSSIYSISKGDTLWQVTKTELEKRNIEPSNQNIMEYMKKIAEVEGCDSIDSLSKKYFIAGKTFEIKDSVFNDSSASAEKDSNHNIQEPLTPIVHANESITVAKNRRIEPIHIGNGRNWADIKNQQDKINALATDKERVIAYHKEIDKSKENYIIVDKKNFTATVYSWNGEPVKSYEIGVATNKTDDLLRRSKKHPENNFASTTAGIYTANYRATGKDAYKRLYNNRVLTLSNDGLQERGVIVKDKDGNAVVSHNGETGVALHQVPNGNTRRTHLLKKEGTSDENNRFSSGCVNFLPEDFDDCMTNVKGVGTKVYILPEDENNYMHVKNGKLHFSQKTYTGKVPTTMTANDELKPIRITAKSDIRQEGKDMAQTLAEKKEELCKELGLDNDTYNELVNYTLGIAGQETKYGNPLAGTKAGHPYWIMEHAPKWMINAAKKLKGKNDYDSRGLTRMKFDQYFDPKAKDKRPKELFEKYNITADSLQKPEQAAIATMIALACVYKNEVPGLKDKMEKCGLSKFDAMLYCYNGRKQKILNETARPTYEYITNIKEYAKDFDIVQYDNKLEHKNISFVS